MEENKNIEKKHDEKEQKKKKKNNEVEELNQKIKLLESEILKSKADLINYRKRKDEEVSNMLRYANSDLLLALLPILDNFERAISLDDNNLSDEVSKFLSGFKMIYANLINILNDAEVKEIPCQGLEFDPTKMEAVLTENDKSLPSGVVLEVLQKGYTYKDKVIRVAMVKVNE